MYEDRISLSGRRGNVSLKTGTIPACVFDQGLEDPLSDDATASVRRLYSVNVRTKDWPYTDAPRIGDTVLLADGTRLTVKSVARIIGDFQMECRT